MSLLLTWNGQNYIIPQTNEVGWGSNLDDFFTALPAGALQKTGGSFTLSSEVDFGAAYGLKTLYYKSRTANPASAGQVRLASADVISFRNNANGADISISKDASDNLQWNAKKILLSGDVVNADINASAAIAYSKLTLTGSVVDADVNASAAIARSKIATGTAYTLLTNSSTGAMSEVSGVGSSGQVLTSNGAGSLPTFQNVAGTGTVNSGTATQVAYYASSTNAVSGNSHLTITSGGSLVTGPSAGLNLRMGNQTFTGAGGVIEYARPDDGAYTLVVGNGAAPNDDAAIGCESGGSLLRLGASAGISFYVSETLVNLFASTRPSATLMVKIITGQAQFPDGSVGTPGVSFISDPDTGLYRSATNQLSVTLGGAQTAIFDTSGPAFAGQTQHANGSVGAPSVTFTSDPDSGMYRIGANDIALGTNGTYALEINSTQQVSVANTKLAVAGNQTYPIVQVVTGTTTTQTLTTSGTYVSTSLTATITPKFSTSKILIIVSGSYQTSNTGSGTMSIFRDTTNLATGGGAGVYGFSTFKSVSVFSTGPAHMSTYDSPATTAPTTYDVRILSSNASTVAFGEGGPGANCFITLLEFAQ